MVLCKEYISHIQGLLSKLTPKLLDKNLVPFLFNFKDFVPVGVGQVGRGVIGARLRKKILYNLNGSECSGLRMEAWV